jgi:hypothetical protein
MRSAELYLVALVTLTLAGCVQKLGLAQVGLDDDLDGVLDDADNCPDVFNPRQQDFDRDGIGDHCSACMSPSDRDVDGDGIDDACDACVGPGELDLDVGEDGIDDGCEPCPAATGQDLDGDGVDDACDSCLRGPPYDEDGDGVANACDDCPSRPDPFQEHANDGDRLGDACDPDTDPLGASGMTSSQIQRQFDGFEDVPEPWEQNDATRGGGIAHVPAQGVAVASGRLSEVFLVETVVSVPTPSADATFEIFVEGSAFCPLIADCYATAACTLDGDGHVVLLSYTGELSTSAETLDVSEPIKLWFRSSLSTKSSTGGMSQLCVGVDAHGVVATAREDDVGIPTGGLRFRTSFTAGPQPIDLRYVWLVSN